jgi:hypothetical protein
MKKHIKPWLITTKELNKWKTVQGIYMFSGHTCQVILLDHNIPIAIFIQKPYRLNKIEQTITGVFALNEHELPKMREYLITAIYEKSVKAFIYELQNKELQLIISHPLVKYLEEREREQVGKLLAA